MLFGLWLVVMGTLLALRPLAVARVSNRLRFVAYPEHPRRSTMRYYRVAGVAIAFAGAAIAVGTR